MSVLASAALSSSAIPPPSKRQKVENSSDGIDDDDLLAAYTCRAQDVIRLEFARPLATAIPSSSAALDSNKAPAQNSSDKHVLNSVAPEFCHQFEFTPGQDDERILSYKAPCVKVTYSAASLQSCASFTYEDKLERIEDEDEDGEDAGSPLCALREGGGIPEDEVPAGAEWCEAARGDADGSFRPPGTCVSTYDSCGSRFEIYHATPTDAGCSSLHGRAMTLALYYIDGASPTSTTDLRWECFFLYKRDEVGGGKALFEFCGYATAFRFTNPFRKNGRHQALRLCQLLVMPWQQRRGHGARLIEAIHERVRAHNMHEITIEDPSDSVRKLRDLADLSACLELGLFSFEGGDGGKAEGDEKNGDATGIDKLRLGGVFPLGGQLPRHVLESAQAKLRITTEQVHRCFEMLKLRAIVAASSTGGAQCGSSSTAMQIGGEKEIDDASSENRMVGGNGTAPGALASKATGKRKLGETGAVQKQPTPLELEEDKVRMRRFRLDFKRRIYCQRAAEMRELLQGTPAAARAMTRRGGFGANSAGASASGEPENSSSSTVLGMDANAAAGASRVKALLEEAFQEAFEIYIKRLGALEKAEMLRKKMGIARKREGPRM